MNISTNYSITQAENQNYNAHTNPNLNNCPEDLFPSNVIDMGDLSDYENIDLPSNKKNETGFFEGVKNFFGGFFAD